MGRWKRKESERREREQMGQERKEGEKVSGARGEGREWRKWMEREEWWKGSEI